MRFRTYLKVLCVAGSVGLRAASCGIDSVCVTFSRFLTDLCGYVCVNLSGTFFVFLQTTGESFLMAVSCPPPSAPAPPKILYVCNRMEKYLGYSKVSVHCIQRCL
jgi:hypothetical protein